jgi:hypothetical protein
MELHSLPKTVFGKHILQGVYHFFRDWNGKKSGSVFTEKRLILLLFLNV